MDRKKFHDETLCDDLPRVNLCAVRSKNGGNGSVHALTRDTEDLRSKTQWHQFQESSAL